MTVNSGTNTYDDVFTRISFLKMGGREYKDNKYKRRPLLKALRDRKMSGSGGPQIVHPVNLGTSANGGSLGRNETFDIQGDVNETWSVYNWAVIRETCFVSWWNIREAHPNKYKMIDLVSSRVDETRENCEDTVLGQLCQDSAAVASDLNPLLSIVATSGATGGLNPSNAGQTTWVSPAETTIDWNVEGIGRTRELYNTIEDQKGSPGLILLPDAMFNETCEVADAALVLNQDMKTKGGTKYADLGSKVPLILNAPVIRDSTWNTNQSDTGLVLDLSGIHLVIDPEYDFKMGPFKDMKNFGRLGQAAVMLLVAQLTCSSRRSQGLLATLS